MTAPKTPTARDELENIEDALVDAILDASEQELRDDVTAAGGNPDNIVAEISSLISWTQMECAKSRLAEAKAGVARFNAHARSVTEAQRKAASITLDRLRAKNPSSMMLAARKGSGHSESDETSLLEDIADLENLDGDPTKR